MQVEQMEAQLESAQNDAEAAADAVSAKHAAGAKPSMQRGASRNAAHDRQASLLIELADLKKSLREAHVQRDESIAQENAAKE